MSYRNRLRNIIYNEANNNNLINWTLNIVRNNRLTRLSQISENTILNRVDLSLIGDLARNQLINNIRSQYKTLSGLEIDRLETYIEANISQTNKQFN